MENFPSVSRRRELWELFRVFFLQFLSLGPVSTYKILACMISKILLQSAILHAELERF